jgi:hypothetical protein
MNRYQSRFIIECLRAGIASSAVSELFSHGQSRVVDRFLAHLDTGAGAFGIEGGYGQGKTHLLKHLAQLARRRGFVVSLVTLSKETPFHHWHHLYAAAIAAAELPDGQQRQPGLRGLLARGGSRDDLLPRMLEFAQQLHPRLAAVLEAYLEAADTELRHRLMNDLMGQALTNQAIGLLHKQATDRRVRLPAARLVDTGRDYLSLAGKAFEMAGYAGWVILFDEFELVCKLSRLQRAKAYANLDVFRQAEPLPGWERLVTLFAFIPEVASDFLLGGPGDLTRLPEVLRLKGLPEAAEAAARSLRWLIEAKNPLALLGETETNEVLDRIATLHEQAHGWKRQAGWGRFYVPTVSAAERMRTKIRYCVEALDLAHLYGEPPVVRSREVALSHLEEDPDYYAGADEVEEVDR